MTKDDKFNIGLALNKIAMMLSDEDFHKVKDLLKQIEQIVAEQTEPQTDCGDFADRLAYERGVKHAWEVAQKVFGSTVTFYEAEDVAKQIDKDINVRSKDCETCKHYKLACELFSEICKYEPTTQTETQNSNLTFKTLEYCDICDHKGCEECIANALDEHCIPSQFNKQIEDECAKEYEELGLKELKELIEADRKTEQTEIKGSKRLLKGSDEPQTEQWHYDEQDNTWYPYQHKSCATCKHALGNWDGESNNCGRCCGADRRFYESKDEPMKTADYCDICKRDMCEFCIADATNPYCVPSHYEINYEPKVEPQTDCAWK